MKTLYFDSCMGVAGDMLMAALLELSPDSYNFLYTINHLGIPGISVQSEKVSRHGMTGTHVRVLWNELEEQSYDVLYEKPLPVYKMEKKPSHTVEIKRLLASL